MKILASLLMFLTLGLLNAQVALKTVKLPSSEKPHELKFLGEWDIKKLKDQSFSVFGKSIQNESKSKFKELYFHVLFIPSTDGSTPDASQALNGYEVLSKKIAGINSKSSSLVNVNATFASTDLPKQTYVPVMIISKGNQPDTSEIITYKFLNYEVLSESVMSANTTAPLEKFSYSENTDKLYLDDSWKVDVDYQNFAINITGGNVVNKTYDVITNSKINLFYLIDNGTGVINDTQGFKLMEASIDEIPAGTQFEGTTIKSSLGFILPPGKYIPVLALVKTDNNGNSSIVSTVKYPATEIQ